MKNKLHYFKLFTVILLALGVQAIFANDDTKVRPYKSSISAGYAFRSDIYIAQWSRLKHLAKLGDPEAQFQLGNMYYSPPKKSGIFQNYKKAFALFLKSARKGNPHSQHNVAVLYLKGDGVEANQSKAMAWFIIAAQNGSKNAQRIVAKFDQAEIQKISAVKNEIEKNIKPAQFAK